MTFTDKHIVETYSNLFEGLNNTSKIELIESLTKSLKKQKAINSFYDSFGAFASNKAPKEIYSEIKASRNFVNKQIKL